MVGTLILIIALLMLISAIAFLIGLFKVAFDKNDREFGVKLLTYSIIAFIIGFGSCTFLLGS